ncbi:hypothetical protein, partial [Burkholderia sp. LMG 13014]|uniref:hypothetical protein n=1 Tax=Burkholderia sp. LMG 13014 TaxID=2709306 RepID=UPI001963403F
MFSSALALTRSPRWKPWAAVGTVRDAWHVDHVEPDLSDPDRGQCHPAVVKADVAGTRPRAKVPTARARGCVPPIRIHDEHGLIDIRYPEGAVHVLAPSTQSRRPRSARFVSDTRDRAAPAHPTTARWWATIPGPRITKAEIGFSRAPGASLYFAMLRMWRFANAAIARRSARSSRTRTCRMTARDAVDPRAALRDALAALPDL